jgi:hypothetical protein
MLSPDSLLSCLEKSGKNIPLKKFFTITATRQQVNPNSGVCRKNPGSGKCAVRSVNEKYA